MLPVQVRVLSSSSCTLSQASALLERFLSSDACSDFFATDYVANVAQALHDSISRRVGGPEHTKHRHFSASSEFSSRSSKQLVDVKQSILVAGNPAPSSPHSKLRSHGKKNLLTGLGHKQSLLTADDVGQDAVVAMEVGSAMPEAEGAFKRHKKKRRHSAVENGPASEMEDSAYSHHDRTRRKKEKHERESEDYGPDDQKHHDKKKGKEEQEIETENAVTEYPVSDSQHLHDKKSRRKEKQGRYMEDMETTENRGSPGSDKKSAHKAKKKVELCNKVANNAGVSVTSLSSKLEEHVGSSKRKRKENKAYLLATPFKVPFLEKNRDETAVEASPPDFENPASEDKKKTKKKKRKKEELGEFVTQTLRG